MKGARMVLEAVSPGFRKRNESGTEHIERGALRPGSGRSFPSVVLKPANTSLLLRS